MPYQRVFAVFCVLLLWGVVLGQSVEDARRLAEKGRLEDALVVLREVLRRDSDNLQAHMLYQEVMVKAGRLEEVRGKYEDLAEKHPDSGLYQYLAARLQEQASKRIEFLQKAVKADGDFVLARRALARELFLARDYRGAIQQLDWLLKKDPKDTEALLLFAALERERSNYDKALELLKRAAEAAPQSPVPLVEMGRVERERARFAEAVKHYEAASKRAQLDWQAILEWGECLVGLGKKKEAVAVWRRALALPLTPQQFAVFAERCALLFVKPPDKALEQALRQAREMVQKDPQKALAALEKLAAQNPDSAVVHSALAAAALVASQPQKAVKAALKALKIAPDFAEPHFILGVFFSVTRADDDALKHLRRAEQLNPFHAETARELGFVLVRKGRPYEAAELAVRYWRLTGDPQRAAELRLNAELAIHDKAFLVKEEKIAGKTLKIWRGLEPAIRGYHLLYKAELYDGQKLVRRLLVMLEEQIQDTPEGRQTLRRWLLIESPLKPNQPPQTLRSFFLPPKLDELLNTLKDVLKEKKR